MLGQTNKLLILSADAEKYQDLIEAAGLQQLETVIATDVHQARGLVSGCNMMLGDPPLLNDALPLADRLEWVQSGWAGVEQLCQPGSRRDYVLTNVKGVFGPLVSEYVMTYLFAFERRIFSMRSNQLKQRWIPLSYRPAKAITLGIIGLGSIGRELALTARHFGMRVTGLNRTGKPVDAVEKLYTMDDLSEFLKIPDYVVMTLPGTPKTNNFFNADVFRMMKPSAVLMNIGRGNSINEPDLVDAIREGIIGGAVLDVFEDEPLKQDSPLWQLANVYITPHTSAISFPEDICAIFVDNYHRFVRRESLRYVVDFEQGY